MVLRATCNRNIGKRVSNPREQSKLQDMSIESLSEEGSNRMMGIAHLKWQLTGKDAPNQIREIT
jgi:hypothetical protein